MNLLQSFNTFIASLAGRGGPSVDAGKFVAIPPGYFGSIQQELQKKWDPVLNISSRRIIFVMHGHSVVAGHFKNGDVHTSDAYPAKFQKLLNDQHRNAMIQVIVTAISGEESDKGAARFADDVLIHRPDVVTIDYGLNDRRIGLEETAASWRAMIETCLQNEILVVLLTPTPDVTEDLHDPQSILAQHSELIRRLADEYQVPLVDSFAAFQSVFPSSEAAKKHMANGKHHPDAVGHNIVASVLFAALMHC